MSRVKMSIVLFVLFVLGGLTGHFIPYVADWVAPGDKTVMHCDQADSGEWYCSKSVVERR